jgi:hypothetical protein
VVPFLTVSMDYVLNWSVLPLVIIVLLLNRMVLVLTLTFSVNDEDVPVLRLNVLLMMFVLDKLLIVNVFVVPVWRLIYSFVPSLIEIDFVLIFTRFVSALKMFTLVKVTLTFKSLPVFLTVRTVLSVVLIFYDRLNTLTLTIETFGAVN